jgi:ketosteroid isomerase-like protein
MSTVLIAFVESMDRCWTERRFDDLAAYLSRDVVMVAPGGRARSEGLPAAIDSYREFMARSQIERFSPSGFTVTERGVTAVVEYGWDMAWHSEGVSHEATGRELLVLTRMAEGWRVIWRTQLPESGSA